MYCQYEQKCRDNGNDVKADTIKQAAKIYMNSFIEDFADMSHTMFPMCSVQYADDITNLGRKMRKMLCDKTNRELNIK